MGPSEYVSKEDYVLLQKQVLGLIEFNENSLKTY